MENMVYSREKEFTFIKTIIKMMDVSFLALIILFFAETSYYLLILQTGIVEYYHSNLSQIWMIPVGGVLGISTIATLKYRQQVVSIALVVQTILMLTYPHFDAGMLFILGFSSGLIAPYLIYQLHSLTQVVVALALAYLLSTFAITILPEARGVLAIGLSLMALLALQWVVPQKKSKKALLNRGYGEVFLWLVLDATLFELLSRSSVAIWKDERFIVLIAFFHLVGLLLAYKFHNSKYNSVTIMGLFILSYLFFSLNMQYPLAIVYPIVISYYNVMVLKRFMNLSFEQLSFASLGLWMSAGMGLFISLYYNNLI